MREPQIYFHGNPGFVLLFCGTSGPYPLLPSPKISSDNFAIFLYFGATGRISRTGGTLVPEVIHNPVFRFVWLRFYNFYYSLYTIKIHSNCLNSKCINKPGFFPRIAQVDVLGHGFGITFRMFLVLSASLIIFWCPYLPIV